MGRISRSFLCGIVVVTLAGCWPAPGAGPAFPFEIDDTCAPWDWDPGFICPTWAIPVDGAGTSPVLGDGEASVYVGTDAGTVYALDAATGTIQWTAPAGSPVTATPALADGTLFVATEGGDLLAFDADGCGAPSCSALWTAETGSKTTGAPAVSAGTLFVGTADGRLLAYRPSN